MCPSLYSCGVCPYAMVSFCAATPQQVNFPRMLTSSYPQIVQEAARAKGRKQTTPVWAQFGDIRVGNVSIISHRFSLLRVASRLECPKVSNPRFLAVHSLTHIAKNLQSRIHECHPDERASKSCNWSPRGRSAPAPAPAARSHVHPPALMSHYSGLRSAAPALQPRLR